MFLERWIMAADRLGSFQSTLATAAFTVRDLAGVLDLCEATSLASDLSARGPVALAELTMDERNALAARVESTLKPSLKNILLTEAVEMERSVGTTSACRMVVLGRATGHETISTILNSEFPNQRGTVVTLTRPSASALSLFDRSRHQLIWTETAASPLPERKPRTNNVERVRFPAADPVPGELWNLSKLARLNPRGLFYSSFAAKPFFTFGGGDMLRYGGLSLLGSAGDDFAPFDSPGHAAEVLFASGVRAIPGAAPIAFLYAPSEGPAGFQEGLGGNRARLILGDPREHYGRIDFDPQAQTASVFLMKTKTKTVLTKMDLNLAKDGRVSAALKRLTAEVEPTLSESIYGDLKGSHRRKRAERLARDIAAIAYPIACRYVEWIERHPEAPVFEREERLKVCERDMIADLPTGPSHQQGMKPELLRRDLYKAFEIFLTGWGLRHPT